MSKTLPVQLTVIRTEFVAPSMRRVVFGGDGFPEFLSRHQALSGSFTDEYVKLVFLAEGYTYPEPLDLDAVRETMPHEAWPVLRTYTIRWVDPEAQEVAIDFVVHGDEGIAGPWAAHAEPGDLHAPARAQRGVRARSRRPTGTSSSATRRACPRSVRDSRRCPQAPVPWRSSRSGEPDDEIAIATVAELEIHWLHRGDAPAGTTTLLDDAVRAWDWLPGRAQAFIHGESALLKSVRPYVLNDRGVARADVSVSAYWRRGATEEGFREWKSAQKDAVMRPGAS